MPRVSLIRPGPLQTKLKLGSQHDPSLGPERSHRNAHCRLWKCAASHSPRLFGPLPSAAVRKGREVRAGPAPPSARPAQWRRAARASPPPGSVTAGGSRNLATPRPRLRRRRRADARQPQDGGRGASGGQSRACQIPSSHSLPRLHGPGVSIPARRHPEPPHPNQSPLLKGFS